MFYCFYTGNSFSNFFFILSDDFRISDFFSFRKIIRNLKKKCILIAGGLKKKKKLHLPLDRNKYDFQTTILITVQINVVAAYVRIGVVRRVTRDIFIVHDFIIYLYIIR